MWPAARVEPATLRRFAALLDIDFVERQKIRVK